MTQKQRVLRGLERAGKHGVTQVDWLGPVTVDGGPPITRLAPRIKELRDEGYPIVTAGIRDSCRVYVLGDAAPPKPVVDPEPFSGELFRLEEQLDSSVVPAIYREAA